MAFRLAHAGPLVFTLEELWPSCRRLSTFHARGRRGVNRIHFKARVGSKRVAPGTYRLVARRPSGRLVMQAKLVIVRGRKPSTRQLAAARRANACASVSRLPREPAGPQTGGAPARTGTARPSAGGAAHTAASPEKSQQSGSSGGVLGATVSLSPTPKKIPFLVLALVGLAMLLLGIGALPRSAVPVAAAGAVIARRRLEIASAGMATFVASVIAYILA